MGACTSRPKDLDHPQAQLPGEKPSDDLHEPLVTKADEAAEATTAAQENNVINGASESQKVEKPLVDLSEPTEPTTKTDDGVSDKSSTPVADLVAVVDTDNNESDDGAQLSHYVDHQTTVTSDKKENHIDDVVVVAASETKEEVDEKQDGKNKAAAAESTGKAEKSST